MPRCNSRKSLLCNSKEMGGLGSSLLPGVNLNHLRDIERINTGKRVGCYKHDTGVCIDFLLVVP